MVKFDVQAVVLSADAKGKAVDDLSAEIERILRDPKMIGKNETDARSFMVPDGVNGGGLSRRFGTVADRLKYSIAYTKYDRKTGRFTFVNLGPIKAAASKEPATKAAAAKEPATKA